MFFACVFFVSVNVVLTVMNLNLFLLSRIFFLYLWCFLFFFCGLVDVWFSGRPILICDETPTRPPGVQTFSYYLKKLKNSTNPKFFKTIMARIGTTRQLTTFAVEQILVGTN